MFAVVIDGWSGDPAELAASAARALGQTAYDLRAAFGVPEGGPAVVGVLVDHDDAAHRATALGRVGLNATVVPVDKHPLAVFPTWQFTLGPTALGVTARDGRTLEVPYDDIGRIVRATSSISTSQTKTTREHQLSIGRTLLTGGLINTRAVERRHTTHALEVDEVLVAFPNRGAPVRMASSELNFQGLGAAMEPSRTASFARLVTELQRHCPAARFDERLRRRATQQQTLGRTLSPDTYLDFAVALVADSLDMP